MANSPALKPTFTPNNLISFSVVQFFGRGSPMWVWVIDQLWTFICVGIAGGIAGAIYQSRRTGRDPETSPIEANIPRRESGGEIRTAS